VPAAPGSVKIESILWAKTAAADAAGGTTPARPELRRPQRTLPAAIQFRTEANAATAPLRSAAPDRGTEDYLAGGTVYLFVLRFAFPRPTELTHGRFRRRPPRPAR